MPDGDKQRASATKKSTLEHLKARIEENSESGAAVEFERAASALFQVPKSAVDEAEAKRPKRRRKKGDA